MVNIRHETFNPSGYQRNKAKTEYNALITRWPEIQRAGKTSTGGVAQKQLTVHPWEACEQGDSLLKRSYQSFSHP